MGTHISFVRSVSLDKWTPEQIKAMQENGNGKLKEIYEYNVPENYRRPNENDTYELEQWIRAKYERKEFMKREGKERANRGERGERGERDGSRSSRNRSEKEPEKKKETRSHEEKKKQDIAPTIVPPASNSHRPSNGPNLLELEPVSKPEDQFGQFVGPTELFTTPSFQTQTSFNSGTNLLEMGAPTNTAVSKQSILELYNAPVASVTPLSPISSGSLSSPTSPSSAPKGNYNVVLDPVYPNRSPVATNGMPGMVPNYVNPSYVNPSMKMAMNPAMNNGYNPAMNNGYNPAMNNGYNPAMNNGYNPAMMNNGFSPVMANRMVPGPSYVNPNHGTKPPMVATNAPVNGFL